MRTVAPYDAAKICAKFGGGGHNAAAGCEFDCDIDQVKNALLKVIKEELE